MSLRRLRSSRGFFKAEDDLREETHTCMLLGVHVPSKNENWHTYSMFQAYVTHKLRYKVMIDGGNYTSICSKLTVKDNRSQS